MAAPRRGDPRLSQGRVGGWGGEEAAKRSAPPSRAALAAKITAVQKQVVALRRQARALSSPGSGAAGAKGDSGAQGLQGPQGPPGVSGYEVVTHGNIFLAGQTQNGYSNTCPPGKQILGGGVAVFNNNIQIMASTPLQSGDTMRWLTTVRTFNGAAVAADSSVNVRLVCANVG